MFEEYAQQAELSTRQHDHQAAGIEQVARRQIQRPAGKADLLRLVRWYVRRHGVAAAQDAAYARQQFTRFERLRQIIVGAHFQAQDAVQRLIARRQHDHRHRRLRTQLAAQGQAVVARQVQVEHDQVGPRFIEDFPHGRAVRRAQGAVGVRFQVIRQQAADIAVVVDDEDCRSGFHGTNYPHFAKPCTAHLYRLVYRGPEETYRYKLSGSGHFGETWRVQHGFMCSSMYISHHL